MRFEARSQDIVCIMLVRPVVSKVFRRGRHFSVNEKDEASLLNCFQQDSSNAFIPRFAGV